MKGFHKNSRRIENEVFILYMPDHELVTASNLPKNPNCFVSNFLFLEWNIYGISMNRIKPYSMVFTWDSSFLFLSKSPRGLSWSMIYVSSFVSFSFVSRNISINSDSFFFYWFFSDRDVWIHGSMCLYRPCYGLTKMCKSSICLCHSMSLFLFAYGIATPFGSIH